MVQCSAKETFHSNHGNNIHFHFSARCVVCGCVCVRCAYMLPCVLQLQHVRFKISFVFWNFISAVSIGAEYSKWLRSNARACSLRFPWVRECMRTNFSILFLSLSFFRMILCVKPSRYTGAHNAKRKTGDTRKSRHCTDEKAPKKKRDNDDDNDDGDVKDGSKKLGTDQSL